MQGLLRILCFGALATPYLYFFAPVVETDFRWYHIPVLAVAAFIALRLFPDKKKHDTSKDDLLDQAED